MNENATIANAGKIKTTCHFCKRARRYKNEKRLAGSNKGNAWDNIWGTKNSNHSSVKKDTKTRCLFTVRDMWKDKSPVWGTQLWKQCSKQATFLEDQTSRRERTSITGRTEQKTWLCWGRRPTFKVEMLRLRPRAATDRPKSIRTRTKRSLNPEVAWRQPPVASVKKSNSANTNNESTIKSIQHTHARSETKM